MVKITLPDGTVKEYEGSVTPAEIAKEVSEGLFRKAIGAEVNGQLWDLNRPVDFDAKVRIVTMDDEKAPEIYRHTMSHIMAQAVMRYFGADKVKLGIGPVIENGFYYDFEIEGERITEEDLPKIEEIMKEIIKEDLPIERFELPKDEAIKFMEEKGQTYKVELIKDIEDDKVSFYRQGEFVDLCRGPHLPSTGKVKHFKLLSLAGAYWRGDERNPMLQRIYGTAFAKKKDLQEHLKMLEEAKKRDHRKLGPQLGLFMIDTDIAPGMPFFLPKGAIVLNELMNFSRELHVEDGYKEVITPLVMNVKLWHQSGHWDHYKENMYFTEKEDTMYAIKPMNCPGHILIFKSSTVSYRDLPVKYFEFGKVHRYERSGVLHGLMRVRAFTQDDAHIFCSEDQIEEEIKRVIMLIDRIYSPFGFTYRAELSTMPEDHMGDESVWRKAESALQSALDKIGLEYKIAEGEGAFYGPKIDFMIKDSIGREWQCATVQLDFLMPERFDVNYIGPDNKEHRVVMIHRAIFGSLERFFGILLEHFAGAFPTWLAPIQVVIIPISDRHVDYASEVLKKLEDSGIRVELDDRRETLGYRIRDNQMKKVPYMLILGDREKESKKISVRTRENKEFKDLELDEFISKISEEIKSRSKDLFLR